MEPQKEFYIFLRIYFRRPKKKYALFWSVNLTARHGMDAINAKRGNRSSNPFLFEQKQIISVHNALTKTTNDSSQPCNAKYTPENLFFWLIVFNVKVGQGFFNHAWHTRL